MFTIGEKELLKNVISAFRGFERQREAKRRTKIQEGEVIPACAETCPSEAIYFGDLNHPKSRVSRLSKSRRAFRLLEDLGTEPKVFYLKEGEWDDG